VRDRLGPIVLVAGIDVGLEAGGGVTRAAVAVLGAGDLQLAEFSLARRPTDFPYLPGLRSFREIPAALAALASLRCVPDLLICDGQGSPIAGASAAPATSAASRRALDRRRQVAASGRLRRAAGGTRRVDAGGRPQGGGRGRRAQATRRQANVRVPGSPLDVASAVRLALAYGATGHRLGSER
jgi:Endonuclease V